MCLLNNSNGMCRHQDILLPLLKHVYQERTFFYITYTINHYKCTVIFFGIDIILKFFSKKNNCFINVQDFKKILNVYCYV